MRGRERGGAILYEGDGAVLYEGNGRGAILYVGEGAGGGPTFMRGKGKGRGLSFMRGRGVEESRGEWPCNLFASPGESVFLLFCSLLWINGNFSLYYNLKQRKKKDALLLRYFT